MILKESEALGITSLWTSVFEDQPVCVKYLNLTIYLAAYYKF